jgi:threonine synthase
MNLYSTNNKNLNINFSGAVSKGIADDGGLFMPRSFTPLPQSFFKELPVKNLNQIALEVTSHLLKDEIAEEDLERIIDESITFDSPLINLDENTFILELFHGPTLAFKDFGAKFMAKMLEHLKDETEITILVATSGDTGSAVANGFYNSEGIKVVLLYPSGKVSRIQEQQLTTLGGNVTALEIDGDFDDCQRLVKQVFADTEIRSRLNLTSANSINIARLLPQSFYYFYAYGRLQKSNNNIVFSVPSGNFGNLTGGLIAYKLGLPVRKFIAAVNANNIFPQFLLNKKYESKPTIKTISNAMDVGNPSNFARLVSLFDNDHSEIEKLISSYSFSDEETKNSIREVYDKFNYIIDPHGAVGYLGWKKFKENSKKNLTGIILETAHPAKFKDIVDTVLGKNIPLPESLKKCIGLEKKSIKISKKFKSLKEFLISK